MEAEHVTVSSVDASDGASAHKLNFMSDGDARNGGPSDVVVGDQEGMGNWTQHSNLMTDVSQIWACGWLDFTQDLEGSGHLYTVLPIVCWVPQFAGKEPSY